MENTSSDRQEIVINETEKVFVIVKGKGIKLESTVTANIKKC